MKSAITNSNYPSTTQKENNNYIVNSSNSSNNHNHYDLIIFSGQSNMQGCPYFSAESINMASASLEYRHNTSSFTNNNINNGEKITRINPFTNKEFTCTKPSSASNQNYVKDDQITKRSQHNIIGSSMVPHFTKAYQKYGIKSFIMHIAEEARAISEWLKTEDLKIIQSNSEYLPILQKDNAFYLNNCQDFDGHGKNHSNQNLVNNCQRAYLGQIRNEVMMEKIKEGINLFQTNYKDLIINHKIFIWNQGERDSDQMVDTKYPSASKSMYKASFLALWKQLKKEHQFDIAVIIRVGLWVSLESDAIIMAAQEELALENDDIILATRAMSYFPHYEFDLSLGHGKKIGYLKNINIDPLYEKTRDTYYLGNHNNRHINEKGNQILGHKVAKSVYRYLYLKQAPILEKEIIDEVKKYKSKQDKK
jgi:hypothetical protein